jgi:hypothetical protein
LGFYSFPSPVAAPALFQSILLCALISHLHTEIFQHHCIPGISSQIMRLLWICFNIVKLFPPSACPAHAPAEAPEFDKTVLTMYSCISNL